MRRIQMNLATLEYYDRRAIYSLAIVALVLVLGLSAFNIRLYSRYRANAQGYEQKISKLDGLETTTIRTGRVSPSKKDLDSLKEQATFVNRLIAMDIFPWDRLLDELETCTPPNVVIFRFASTKEPGRIRIEGKAASMNEITDFLKALGQSRWYRQSVLLNVSTQKETGGAGPASDLTIRFEIEAVASVQSSFSGRDEMDGGEK